MTDGGPVDFFVSYTRPDEDWAVWIAAQLASAGYGVRIQAWDFQGNFVQQMLEAMRDAPLVVAVVSDVYLTKRYATDEWSGYYVRDPLRVIPVAIETVEVPHVLGAHVGPRLWKCADAGSARAELLDNVRAHLDRLPPTFEGRPQPASSPTRPPALLRAPFPQPRQLVRATAPTAPRPGAPAAGAEPAAAEAAAVTPPPVQADPASTVVVALGDRPADAAWPGVAALFPAAAVVHDLLGDARPAEEQVAAMGAAFAAAAAAGEGDAAVDAVLVLSCGATVDNTGVHLTLSSGSLPWERIQEAFTALAGAGRPVRPYVVLDVRDAAGASVAVTADRMLLLTTGIARLAEWARWLLDLGQDHVGQVGHWSSLSADDLARVAGMVVTGSVADPAGVLRHVGLFANPLAWPGAGSAPPATWCAVLSEADRRQGGPGPVARVVTTFGLSRDTLNKLRRDRPPLVPDTPLRVEAGRVLASPADLARALRHVCEADVALFDLTNYEPAVMLLLGVRSVIRRGVTVCLTGEHEPPWADADPPFHVREIGVLDLRVHRSEAGRVLQQRVASGIRQLAEARFGYRDLPPFDDIRGLPTMNEASPRPWQLVDGEAPGRVLALVPFAAEYQAAQWEGLKSTFLITAQNHMDRYGLPYRDPVVERTLDMSSPRVASAQLFEAIRLTEFSLVDLTALRPNVVFELGVRLAANALHPVVVHDPSFVPASTPPETTAAQGRQLCRLLDSIAYDLGGTGFDAIVGRHLALKDDLVSPRSSLTTVGGLPPRGVYELAWASARARDEFAATAVPDILTTLARPLLRQTDVGRRVQIFPPRHPLEVLADRTGRELLLAAFLYLEQRDPAALAGHLPAWTALHALLRTSGDEADMAMAVRIVEALATHGLAAAEEADDPDRLRFEVQVHRKAEDWGRAVDRQRRLVEVLEARRAGDADVGPAAAQLADEYGQLGGLLKRAGDAAGALDAYRTGAALERANRLEASYNRVNVVVAEILADGSWLPAARDQVRQTYAEIEPNVRAHRYDSSWAWADVGLLALLGDLPDAARAAYDRLEEINPPRWELESIVATLDAVHQRLAARSIGLDGVPDLAATIDRLRRAAEIAPS